MAQKRSSQVDKGESVRDIEIDDYLCFLQKHNRKKIEKAFDGVHFDQSLLMRNDNCLGDSADYPFKLSLQDLKLH